MPQRKHKPEEIVAKLRQVDVLLSQGRPVAEAIRTIGVTPFTYYRCAVTPAFHPPEAGVRRSNWRGCADGAMGDWRSASVSRSRSPIAASWAA